MTASMRAEQNTPHTKGSAGFLSRWDALKAAIESLARNAGQSQAKMEFRLFKSKGNTCELEPELLSLTEAQAFAQEKNTRKPEGSFTPLTAAILEGIKLQGEAKARDDKKLLVFVTDGVPDCPGGKKKALGQTKEALRKAALAGVQVVIIGAGAPEDLERLTSDVCTTLGTADELSLDRQTACSYIKAPSAAQLIDALLAAACLAIRNSCNERAPFQGSLDPIADVAAVGSSSGWHCSGVLVSSQHVLTARHCLPATRVLFGLDVVSPDEILKVKQSIPHPDPQQDAALLVLSEPTKRPIRQRRSLKEDQPPLGVVRHAGFGAQDPEGREGFGRKHYRDVWAHGWNCDATESQRLGCHPEFEFVLPAGAGRDTCVGDSGGPVFERIDIAPMCATSFVQVSPPTYRLLGITSRPVANARQRCGDGGVYGRLDQIAGWLDSLLPQSQEKP
ncbi:hypothetical protein D7X30_07675 [Corallococcus sp. AB011P]|nr:hypothetical protein D7X30_07675 [Corallococcus sp. AB011P]